MLKIKEDLLQFIWANKLLQPKPLLTVSGKEIFVVKCGTLNHDSGPDFFDAQIRTEGILLVGNIEIHTKTSDWLKHGHQSDRGYDNLILHVVYQHDTELEQNKKNGVEVLELSGYIDESTLKRYALLCESKEALPCHKLLDGLNDLKFIAWIDRMAAERLEEKCKRITQYFENSGGDFTQTFYVLLLRNFGFKVNALPFELISAYLPLNLLLKHANDLQQLEALVLGVAGLLDQQLGDKYLRQLQNEFEFLSRKYKLTVLDKKTLKFSRLRPSNFPNLRLVQFAAFVHHHADLLQAPHQFISAQQIIDTLKVKPGAYWQKHYLMDGNVQEKELGLGEDGAENIIINTFAPFYFFYGKKLNKSEFTELGLGLLQTCRFENNKKTKLFRKKADLLKSASASQACINLYDQYCSKKRCLNCGVAAAILKPV